jgi:hypothetical protein
MLISHTEVSVELVSIIAHYLVCEGIRDAWKLRGICNTFKHAITDDIILRQTGDVLQSGRKIMEQLMPHYLFHRIQKRLDVHENLPVSHASFL